MEERVAGVMDGEGCDTYVEAEVAGVMEGEV